MVTGAEPATAGDEAPVAHLGAQALAAADEQPLEPLREVAGVVAEHVRATGGGHRAPDLTDPGQLGGEQVVHRLQGRLGRGGRGGRGRRYGGPVAGGAGRGRGGRQEHRRGLQPGDLQGRPGAEDARGGAHRGDQTLPGHPGVLAHLLGVGPQLTLDPTDQHGAQLVLDDPAGVDGAVAEVGQHDLQVAHLDPELLTQPPADGVGQRLPGARVPAARVRPHPRPGDLAQRPPGDEHPSLVVEEVEGERLVQRGVGRVHGGAGGGPQGRPVVVHEDDLVHRHRSSASLSRQRRHRPDRPLPSAVPPRARPSMSPFVSAPAAPASSTVPVARSRRRPCLVACS